MMLKRKKLQLKILKININSKKINVSFNSENKYYNAEYYLIKRGLHKYFNIDKFKIMYTKNGKPFLDNNVYLSISHDKDIVDHYKKRVIQLEKGMLVGDREKGGYSK